MIVELKKDHLGHKAGERIVVVKPDADDLVAIGVAEHVYDDDPLLPLVREHIQTAVDQTLAEHRYRKHLRPKLWPSGHAPAEGFADFGEFAQCVKAACIPGSRPDERLAP